MKKNIKACLKLPLVGCVLFTFKHVYHLQKHKIIKRTKCILLLKGKQCWIFMKNDTYNLRSLVNLGLYIQHCGND
jgi:hypothetical protein